MHALGIPTTRSLAVATTGEPVYREGVLQGAVLTRVAASHIRVGTMQWAAGHNDEQAARALADYTLARHYPELADAADRYLALFDGDPRPAGVADCALAAGRLHPRRDEYRQHGALGRNDRLRPLCVHGRLRSRNGLQLDRRRRPLRLREPADDRALESGPSGRGDAVAVRSGAGAGGGAGHRRAQSLSRAVRPAHAGRHAGEARTVHARRRRRDARRRPARLDAAAVRRFHQHLPFADQRAAAERFEHRRFRSGVVASSLGGAPRTAAAAGGRGPGADAAAQSGRHPAQSQRRGGPGGGEHEPGLFRDAPAARRAGDTLRSRTGCVGLQRAGVESTAPIGRSAVPDRRDEARLGLRAT